MSDSPTLIPLQCLKCQAALPAGLDEVAWVCPTCGQGLILDEEQPGGLDILEIHYAAGIPTGARGRPFWVAQGEVRLRRETYSGNQAKQSAEFWQSPRLFLVPAYQIGLAELVEQGTQLVSNPPALAEGGSAAFRPVTLNREDLRPMAEFIVMGVEAARRDDLKTLHVQIRLGPAALWILP